MELNCGIQLSRVVEIERIIGASYYELSAGCCYEGEKQSCWELVFVEQGKLHILSDEGAFVLKKGEVICIESAKYQYLKAHQGNASAIVLSFIPAQDWIPRFDNKVFFINHQQKQYLNDIVSEVRVLLQHKGKPQDSDVFQADIGVYNEQILKNTIELLILSLLSAKEILQYKPSDLYKRSAQRKDITNDIIQYLNEMMGEPINLQSIADKFSYSPSSIKRIFKRETGYSIIDYYSNIRIDRAKRMLESSDASIGEISDRLGFSNACYFSNIFKSKEGISPSAYRKSVRHK